MARFGQYGVMYVARDLRTTVLPDYSLPEDNDAARAAYDRMYPPCIWTKFADDHGANATAVWKLTTALLAYIWGQLREIDRRITAGAVPERKVEELHRRVDRIMEWASVALPPGETLREAKRQRQQKYVLPATGRSHTPQLSLLDERMFG
jgi:hypothetical protein